VAPVTLRLDNGREQFVLAGKIGIQSGLADVGTACHGVHAGGAEAMLAKQQPSGVQDALQLATVVGPLSQRCFPMAVLRID
jgi:hypothetical protein